MQQYEMSMCPLVCESLFYIPAFPILSQYNLIAIIKTLVFHAIYLFNKGLGMVRVFCGPQICYFSKFVILRC